VLIWLDKLKVEVRKGYACTGITSSGVKLSARLARYLSRPITVINAAGMNSDPEGAAAFNGTAPVVKAIGDCVSAGLIGDAHSGCPPGRYRPLNEVFL